VESVVTISHGFSYEIILVDNASSECDPDLFLDSYPDIRLIKSNQNLGFAGGNNLGISHALGEYILLLNSDTALVNNAIYLSLEKIKSDTKIGALSCKLTYPDGKTQSVSGRFPSLIREVRELLRLNKTFNAEQRAEYYLGEAFNHQAEKEVDWVWGAFFMFKRSDLKHFPNGKLHDNFFMYYEDVQWCWHFKKVLKKEIVYYPKGKVIHFIGGSDQAPQEIKNLSKIIPNKYKWMIKVKGIIYTRAYFFIKAVHLFTLRANRNKKLAEYYLKLALTGNVN